MNPAARFWGTAAGVSIAFAAVVPVLFPFRTIGLDPAVDRERIWLLCVFTMALMLMTFGLSALGGGLRRIGVGDVLAAGGVREARARMELGTRGQSEGYTRNFAAWCIATGALLMIIYFVLYAALE